MEKENISNIFKVFLWKNFRFIYYNKQHITFLLLAECLILGFYFKVSLVNQAYSEEVIYNFKDLGELKSQVSFQDDDFIYYAPKNDFLAELMEGIRTDLSLTIDKVVGVDNVRDVMESLQSKRGTNSLGVNFESFEDKLKYSISSARIKLSTNHIYYNDRDVVHIQDDDQYLSSWFFTLQHLIDLKYMALKGSSSNQFDVTVASMPTISLDKIDSERVLNFGSFVVILLNILLLVTFLVPMVEEKQDGIREYLTIATQYSHYNGVAFFLSRSVIYIIFMIVAISIGCCCNALGTAPIFYVIILFTLYLISTMFYAYFISICFNSVFYTKVGGIVLLLTPYLFFLIDGYLSRITTIFLSTKTFLEAIRSIQVFTNKRSDFHYHYAPSSETYNSILLLSLMVLQTVCYGLLYFYFSKIFPGRNGVRQFNVFSKRTGSDNLLYEKLQNDLALKIQDLTKTYTIGSLRRQKRTVVQKLNMDIESKKITVLLGHNGAGKTTTINMILGLVTKTSGKISIPNHGINSFRPIGYCPQNNVYMQYLTCSEHLQFFAMLRGMSASKAKGLAEDLLEKLHLKNKANVYGKHLSGGMKRRLCLGMAIVGETTLVILDEPSSGLDIESRRLLWDILLELRKSTAILITTHHMEEADVLGDQISILMNGTLQSTGTSIELKRSSDCGFILKLLIKPGVNRMKILDAIKKIIPDAYIRSYVDPTLSIHLPYSDLPNYEEMLKKLEVNSEKFGILHIGLSDSTLNDVFLKKHNAVIKSDDEVDGPLKRYDSKDYSKLNLMPNVWKAVFYKKYVFIKREWKYFLFMMLIPFITTFLALSIVLSAGSSNDLEKLSLNLHHLKHSTIYMKSNPQFFVLQTALENEIRKFHGVPIKIEDDETTDFLLDLQKQNLPHFYDNVVGAIEVHERDGDGSPEIKIFFSGNIIHSSTVLLNLVDNALLAVGGKTGLSIEAQYLPIQQILDINPHRLEYYAAIIPIGMFFYIMYFVSLPYKEEKTKFKYLQGVSKIKYWLTFFTFDMLHHFVICILIFVLHKVVLPEIMYNTNDLVDIISSIFFYGLAYLPILYLMATAFSSMSTLTTYLFFMLIVSSIAPLITSGSTQSMVKFEEIILVLSLLPDFALNHQMRIINENFFIKRRTKLMGANSEVDNTPENLLSKSTFFCFEVLIFLAFGSFFIFVWENLYRRQTLIRFTTGIIRKIMNLVKCKNCRKTMREQCAVEPCNDEAVKEEKEHVKRILGEDMKDYPLIVKNLTKCYPDHKKAVDELSFSVKEGECFGLLGVNGAGKTTTFQMLTANECITGGEVAIQGFDIKQNESKYKQKFGYCPQSDCLNNFMTSYEILKYMALLRGISCSEVNKEIMSWLENLDLVKYKDTQIRYYSGGTKRKLNAAIAMIGSPSLIMLDEPTTGVDPISRRFLWDCIEKFKNNGKTVVLTSHSMDECEQLCNRLAIMANGQFQCLGHIPKLKADFGEGFTINFRIKPNVSDEDKRILETNMLSDFENCTQREHHAGLYTYFVAAKSITWSAVFAKLYDFYKSHQEIISVFSINETSLEDIFLEFEKKSRESKCEDLNEIIAT